jgi:hypothetical protein
MMSNVFWGWVISLHLMSTFMMAGLVLLVQVVHYPFFAFVPPSVFVDMHKAHTTQITYIVGPLMLIELASAVVAVYLQPTPLWWTCLALSGLCFALTGWLAVPQHNILATGWNAQAHARLVATNIWRTLCWLLHAALAGGWLARRLSGTD